MALTEKDIKEFHDFESSNNLAKIFYKKNKIWPSIRYAVFYSIFDDSGDKSDKKLKDKYRYIYEFFVSLKSFVYLFKSSDIILYDGARNISIGAHKINPTTFTLLRVSQINIL